MTETNANQLYDVFYTPYYNRLECVNSKTGDKFIVWQRVLGNSVVYVDANDNPVKLPKVYEAVVVADELERPE